MLSPQKSNPQQQQQQDLLQTLLVLMTPLSYHPCIDYWWDGKYPVSPPRIPSGWCSWLVQTKMAKQHLPHPHDRSDRPSKKGRSMDQHAPVRTLVHLVGGWHRTSFPFWSDPWSTICVQMVCGVVLSSKNANSYNNLIAKVRSYNVYIYISSQTACMFGFVYLFVCIPVTMIYIYIYIAGMCK